MTFLRFFLTLKNADAWGGKRGGLIFITSRTSLKRTWYKKQSARFAGIYGVLDSSLVKQSSTEHCGLLD